MPDIQKLIRLHGIDEIRHQLALKSGYERRVPTIDEFLDDPEYLGDENTGKCAIDIYPVWRLFLRELFPNPYKCTEKEVMLACSVGSGKTTIAIIAAAYDTCRLLSLKDPHKYLGTGRIKALTMACVNRSRDLAKTVLYNQVILLFKESPFFRAKLGEAKKNKASTLFPNNIDVVYGSRGNQILGADIYCAILSELAFANTTKQQAYLVYTNATRRFRSRFMHAKAKYGLYPGRLYIDSSMSDEDSFVNADFLKGKQNDSECKVALYSYWEVHGHKEGLYSGETFTIFIGDFETDPKILEPDEDLTLYEEDKLLKVPVEHKKEFEDDLISALQDIANCITASTSSWLPGSVGIDLATVVPCGRDIIQLKKGEPFKLSYTPDADKAPRYIGLDLSKSHDKTGIAISYVRGYRETKTEDGVVIRTPVIHTELAVAIQAAKSSEIPIGAIRDWIIGLQVSNKINIALVTADQFQSTVVIQDLNQAGITAELLSVDRTMVPYDTLRSGITQGTSELPDSPLLRQELKHLEIVKAGKSINSTKRKVDHPLGSYICPETKRTLEHSKDVADAVCQSHYSALSKGAKEALAGGQLEAYFDTVERNTGATSIYGTIAADGAFDQGSGDLSEEDYAELLSSFE